MSPDAIDSAREFLAAIDAREGISCICDVCDVEEWLGPLLAHIDAQAAQIEALKEKLIEDRSMLILRRQHDYEHNYSFTKSDALDLARQQLKAEMHEVDWDE